MLDRRDLLRSGLALGALWANGRRALAATSPYGPLEPARDESTGLSLLLLPEGFRYRSFGWEGDPMADGAPTPDRHDGMALVYSTAPASFVLMRNHERSFATRFGNAATPVFDGFALPPAFAGMGGGTTALIFEDGRLVRTEPTLAGTLVNCAGGATPWGSWLTCEEIVVTARRPDARHHGYVFEVPAPALGPASAVPIVDMGRMQHEAVAVDPATGFAYLTEDNGPSGFYRFRPKAAERRIGVYERGGHLEMMKVRGAARADLGAPLPGATFEVEWVLIDAPDADSEHTEHASADAPLGLGLGRSGPFLQGEAQGAARFRRLEGAFADAGLIYFTDTTGGAARRGTLWALAPGGGDAPDLLRCVYVATDEHEADRIDNVCVGPRGGVVLCEDGGGVEDAGGAALLRGTRVLGLAAGGAAFPFAENDMLLDSAPPGRAWIAPGDYRRSEFAGACFSPDGERLFVNVQTPGVTFEIRGPWRRGPL